MNPDTLPQRWLGYVVCTHGNGDVVGEIDGVQARGVRLRNLPDHPGFHGYLPAEAIESAVDDSADRGAAAGRFGHGEEIIADGGPVDAAHGAVVEAGARDLPGFEEEFAGGLGGGRGRGVRLWRLGAERGPGGEHGENHGEDTDDEHRPRVDAVNRIGEGWNRGHAHADAVRGRLRREPGTWGMTG